MAFAVLLGKDLNSVFSDGIDTQHSARQLLGVCGSPYGYGPSTAIAVSTETSERTLHPAFQS